MGFKNSIERYVHSKRLPEDLADNIYKFCLSYQAALVNSSQQNDENLAILETFVDLVVEQLDDPYHFEPFHQKITTPFDYYAFGLNLMRPLISFEESTVVNLHAVEKMNAQITQGDNVILFANHQTEPDPQVINLLLEDSFPHFAKEIIFVAGHRVTRDPLAVPFSKGCNLLCIYSKKHIENPKEHKQEKQLHNQKTMKKMQSLLQDGGKCIFVAPSGGRDRMNDNGVVEVAPFDPQSIEMFRLIARQSKKPTHFYPLALSTYPLLPPPSNVEKAIGETRHAKLTPVHLSFGNEIEMDHFPGNQPQDRHASRELRANYIYELVKKDYACLN